VRALWDLELIMLPAHTGDDEPWPAPALREEGLCLGDLAPPGTASAQRLYRAAAAHGAAHRAYGGAPFESGTLNLRQQLMIALVEDARVEALAMAQLPGLARLWLDAHDPPGQGGDLPALLQRMSHALLCAGVPGGGVCADTHPLVVKAVERFTALTPQWADPAMSRELGLALANDLGQMRLAAHSRAWPLPARYRDDNRHLFVSSREMEAPEEQTPAQVGSQALRGARLKESDSGARLDLAEAGAPQGEAGGLRLQQSGAPPVLTLLSAGEAQGPSPSRCSYPEWHYRMARHRDDWCQLYDGIYPQVRPARALLDRHAHTLRQVRRQLDTWRLREWRIARAQSDGDELDLDAAVRAQITRRMGREPDPRIYHRWLRSEGHGPTVLVLLDLSVSLARPVNGSGQSLAELARDAALLLAETLHLAGHGFAIHGFHSDTRHRVDYRRFKDFHRPLDENARARLAALQVSGSTRLGAALRHGGQQLLERAGEHPLLLVISDGEPSDIDVHDPQHLSHDAREAVREQRALGIAVHCLNLEPEDAAQAAWIFGARHVSRVHDLSQLPRRLPELYLSLTRQS